MTDSGTGNEEGPGPTWGSWGQAIDKWATLWLDAYSTSKRPHPLDAESEHGPFQFEPLDLAKRQIRLVRLEEKVEENMIECTIIHATLDDHPEYIALSYTWQDEHTDRLLDGQTQYILLNGRPFAVTSNLFAALVYLKIRSAIHRDGEITEPESQMWWIDALSIDQTNDKERGHQVGLMKEIYETASRVDVWLGLPNEVTYNEEFEDKMREVYEYYNRAFRDSEDDGEELNEILGALSKRGPEEAFVRFMDKMKAIFGTPEEESAARKTLEDLLERKWWTRIWTAIEIAAGLHRFSGYFICGGLGFEHGLLGLAIAYFDVAMQRRFRDQGLRIALATTPDLTAKEMSLEDLVFMHGVRSQATDPRDLIYGLLGLTDDAQGIRPEYSKSVQEVYCDVTKSFISSRAIDDPSRLRLLSMSCVQSPNRLEGLPSWAVDFTTVGDYTSLLFIGRPPGMSEEPWYAAGGKSVAAHLIPSLGEDPMVFPVAGVAFATIEKVGPNGTLTPPEKHPQCTPEEIIERAPDVLSDICQFAIGRRPLNIQTGPPYQMVIDVEYKELCFLLTLNWGWKGPQKESAPPLNIYDYVISIAWGIQNIAAFPGSEDIIKQFTPDSEQTSFSAELDDDSIAQKAPSDAESAPASGSGPDFAKMRAAANIDPRSLKQSVLGTPEYKARLAFTAPMLWRLEKALYNRVIFRTDTGDLGVAGDQVQEGDILCALLGAEVPFVLRKEGSQYRLVSDALIQGFMDSQAFKEEANIEIFNLC